MNLAECLQQFFRYYLPKIKGVSDNTIKSYRDTFTLFLPFAAEYHSCTINSLEIEHLSMELIIEFLQHLETDRSNVVRSRNLRLAVFKSFARMLRLLQPESRKIADRITNIPQKREQKKLIAYLTLEEICMVQKAVNLKRKEGFRDYTILHLLFDSGARASEVATLNLDYFDQQKKTLAILGKGNRFHQLTILQKTTELIQLYIEKYRATPKPLSYHRLFINQRGKEFTRHGIHCICKKYLALALPEKRLKDLSTVHSFRHSCAMHMLSNGESLADIQNRLGHEKIQTTTGYLRLELQQKREVQKNFIEYTESILSSDPHMEDLVDWERKEEILAWLDKL